MYCTTDIILSLHQQASRSHTTTMPSSSHWNVLSSWSKAGVGTSIVLELKRPPTPTSSADASSSHQKQKPSPRVAFDIGATPCFDDAVPARYVFVSHGHVDHVGALFSHARAHAVTFGGAAPTYFVPAALVPQIEQCRDAMSSLDAWNSAEGGEVEGARAKSLISMKLVPVRDGEEVSLKGICYGSKTSFFARAFRVDHAGHPAMGYIIGSRTTAGLKEEYQNLDGAKIRDLVKAGVSIKADPVERIEVAYTGDTCARGLINGSVTAAIGGALEQHRSIDVGQLFRAELLFCELTFLDSSEDAQQVRKACERGHLHINEVESIFASHSALEVESGASTEVSPKDVVFYHLSAKYQPASRALDLIAEGLPRQLHDRCHVAISSMLSHEEKSCDNSTAKLMQNNGCIQLADYVSWKNTQQSSAF